MQSLYSGTVQHPLRTDHISVPAADIIQRFQQLFPFMPGKREELVLLLDNTFHALQHRDMAVMTLTDLLQQNLDRYMRFGMPEKLTNLHVLANEFFVWGNDVLNMLNRNGMYAPDGRLYYFLSNISTKTGDILLEKRMP